MTVILRQYRYDIRIDNAIVGNKDRERVFLRQCTVMIFV